MSQLPAPYVLKPLGNADYPQVAALHLLGWQTAYRPIFGAQALQQLSLPAFAQLWHERLALADRQYLGLWQQDTLMGFAGYGPAEHQPHVAEIYHFYLHPNCWGKGVAGPLMQQVLDALNHQHYHGAELWVLEANKRAQTFYARWGFVPNGLRQQRHRFGLVLQEMQLQRPLGA